MIKITLRGQVRGGKNHIGITQSGHRYPNKTFEAWRDNAVAQILAQVRPRTFIQVPVKITVDYTPGDRRKRDAPAVIDALCHVLERAGVVADDVFLEDWDFRKLDPDRDSCGVVLWLDKK